ncbi:MAG: LytR/AlgR family response regulator transcription factor [Saprospiraceae bacterium]
MKALIVEDEPLVAKDLKKLVAEADPSIQVLGTLGSVEAAVEWLNAHPEPDLMFLDIQLSDGTSFDIFERATVRCPVIFTTAYDDYAIRAFKVNSIDYLLKPVDKKELALALEKFRWASASGQTDIREQVQALISQMANPRETKNYKERFLAHQGKMNVVVSQHNIACFQKDALIYIVTTDKQQLVTDFETMDELEDLLDPAVFFRANRQVFLNVNAVESYRTDSYGKLQVKMKGAAANSVVDISREKAQAFKNWLGG